MSTHHPLSRTTTTAAKKQVFHMNVPWMVECSLNVPWMFTEIRRLVLLTLILGTHVCKLYSASTLVLFFKCFLQLGWRLTGFRSTQTECSLNVHWDTPFGLVNPRLRYSSWHVVFCVNLGTFCKCFLQLGWRLTGVHSTQTECSLNVSWMFTECSLNNPCMFHECSLNVPWQLDNWPLPVLQVL
jgi:hypothetical protein